MLNKKGLALETVIVAVLLLIVLVTISFNLWRSQTLFGAKYNELELKTNARSCQAQGALAEVKFDKDFGNMGDGFPDGCDLCLGGDDAQDKDNDGIPDSCDPDDENPPEKKMTLKSLCESKEVKGTWNDKKKQCKLPCYLKTPPCTRA